MVKKLIFPFLFIAYATAFIGLFVGDLHQANARQGIAINERHRAEKRAHRRFQRFACGAKDKKQLFNRYGDEVIKHRIHQQRLSRRMVAAQPVETFNADIGDIAVIEDDGQIVADANPFDLEGKSLTFTPGGASSYTVSAGDALALEPDPGARIEDFETDLDPPHTPPDDGFKQIDFGEGFSFSFYGVSYSRVLIGTNGFLSFDSGTGDPEESAAKFINDRPIISGFWHDLDTTDTAGPSGIFVKQFADKFVATWKQVPEFDTYDLNTFQIILHRDGRIQFSYTGITTRSALVGISPGSGAVNPHQIDLSRPPGGALTGAIFEVFVNSIQVDILALAHAFYQTHRDEFDFLYLWTDFDYDLGGHAFAFYLPVRNDVRGIGLPAFDNSLHFGSAGKLRGILNVNNIVGQYPELPTERFLGLNSALSVLGQEQGHAWLAFVYFDDNGNESDALLGRANAHWSFFFNTESIGSTTDAPRSSAAEGNVWRDNGDGTFSTPENQLIDYYSLLDLYLIGLAAPSEVPELFLIDPGFTFTQRGSSPRARITLSATKKTVSIDQIIAVEGPRVPDVGSAPKRFRAAFILLVRNGTAPAQSTLDKLNSYRVAWENYFKQSTGQRGAMITTTANDTVAPSVILLLPNGGEVIRAGTRVTIRWQSSDNVGIVNQKIKLSYDGGATFPLKIVGGLPGDAQRYRWQVPADIQLTTQARILVQARDAAKNKRRAISQANFRIIR